MTDMLLDEQDDVTLEVMRRILVSLARRLSTTRTPESMTTIEKDVFLTVLRWIAEADPQWVATLPDDMRRIVYRLVPLTSIQPVPYARH